MKKLLHIALGQHNNQLWKSLNKHFKCKHYDWTLKKDDIPELQSDILSTFRSFSPDIVFMQIQYGGIITPDTVKKMADECPVYSWTGDVRAELESHFIECAPYMTSLFTNMIDVNKVLANGHRADFLQVGFDNNTFTPVGPTGDYPEIVFLGSYYPDSNFPLTHLRRSIVASLHEEFGDRFGAYGTGWSLLGLEERYLKSEQESEAYRTAKICINASHFNSGRYSSDRLFRIMGAGGLALSHDFHGIEKDFVIGKQLVTWHNIPDLIQKINYYLSHEYEAELIRMNGCKYVRENFTWDNFVQNFKQIANL